MSTQSANLNHKGFNPRKVISRPFFKLRFSTWEVFKNPCLKKEEILDQILRHDVGTSLSYNEINLDELSRILKQLENKIRKKNWKKLVDYHCRKQVLQNKDGSDGMKKIITPYRRGLDQKSIKAKKASNFLIPSIKDILLVSNTKGL